jgi:hypothetical protein
MLEAQNQSAFPGREPPNDGGEDESVFDAVKLALSIRKWPGMLPVLVAVPDARRGRRW